MVSYNEKDKEYISYAFAGESAYGVLNPDAEHLLVEFRKLVADRRKMNSADRLAVDLSKLLSRAETVLFYSSKIAFQLSEIERLPSVSADIAAKIPVGHLTPPALLISRQREMGMEFETLVLHSLASLDTLSKVISANCVDAKCYDKKGREISAYFSKLKNSLVKSQKSDIRSEYLLSMFMECENSLRHIILPADGKKTLRNYITHETTSADLTETNFIVHWLPDGRVLRLDCEVYGVPLVETARSLSWITTYLIIRAVGIFLARDARGGIMLGEWAWKVGRSFFEPIWNHSQVSWRKFLTKDSNVPKYSVAKITESGFFIEDVHLCNSILDHSMAFSLNSQ